ncbi:BOS complex subunit ncln-like isoform X2 [Montipora foliosa]|uniref:BOS complex subunit ncln-like isoform X2 n=1 Tax=Montipora foliosa TaxID=591990 RepID=UPI0035F20D14
MLENLSDFLELFRSFPVSISVLFVVPVVLLSGHGSPVMAAHEFPVFRMQQFDLHQTQTGSRSSLVNMEARPLTSDMLTRRCVVTRLSDLTIDRFKEAVQTLGAGAVLILLPKNTSLASLEQMEEWQQLERDLLTVEIPVAVYFAYEDKKLTEIYKDIETAFTSDHAGSAFEALLGVASTSGYQMVVNVGEAKEMKDMAVTSLQGKLAGMGIDEQLPTIAVVTHYDAFGVAPSLAFGSDDNGSGVVALLELARLFSRLYTDSRMQARYNLVFFLSGAGKFNYQGTKRWMEENLDNPEASVLSEVDFVLCLDSIGKTDNLFLHVSKPPKEGSPAFALVEEFKSVAEEIFKEVNFSLIHKKINLAEETLSWEHERFSLHTQRLPAGTLSHFVDPQVLGRSSIFDVRSSDSDKKLERNIAFMAEVLVRHIFNLTTKGYPRDMKVFGGSMAVDSHFVKTWTDYLSSHARAAQMFSKDHPLLTGLEQTLTKFVKDVKRFSSKADKRDPEYVFYDKPDTTMFAYRVKPAVFDLFLAVGIASYLGLFYLALLNFSILSEILPKPNFKTKQQ